MVAQNIARRLSGVGEMLPAKNSTLLAVYICCPFFLFLTLIQLFVTSIHSFLAFFSILFFFISFPANFVQTSVSSRESYSSHKNIESLFSPRLTSVIR
jgi:hypothetical protein